MGDVQCTCIGFPFGLPLKNNLVDPVLKNQSNISTEEISQLVLTVVLVDGAVNDGVAAAGQEHEHLSQTIGVDEAGHILGARKLFHEVELFVSLQ